MKRVSFRLSNRFIKLFRAVVFSTLIIPAVLLISCKGVDNVPIEIETERTTETTDSPTVVQEYVTLSVSADFPTYGRTVNPTNIDFSTDMALSFTLYGEWKGEGDEDTDVTFEKTWTASTIEGEQKTAYQIMCADTFQILKGTWDFTLSAFKNGKEMYYQTLENKTLNAGENDTNAISLDFGIMKEAEEGNGSVTVTLDFPADKGITSVKAGLIKLDGTELSGFAYESLTITASETSANTKTVTYTKANVPSGTYRIKFALYDSNNFLAKTSRDIIHIAPCNESTGSLTVTEINTLYKITYAGISEEYNCVTDYSVQDDYELVESYNASQTIVLPVQQLKKGAYYPEAWYDTEDFSGEPITGWEIGDRAEAVTVYPKWYTTGSDAATAISALTKAGDYTIRMKGNITSDNFTSINTALKGLSSTLDIGVTLDLSEATMTEIPSSAFSGCSKLKGIVIPGCVTSIGNCAFNGCTGLKTLRLEDGTTALTLGYNSFNSNGTGKGLFRDCPLESLYVGRNLDYASYKSSSSNFTYSIYPQYFGYSAFANIASTLETIPELNVEIGANVTSIPMYMFYGCKGLKSVTIAESAQITSIGNYAFYDCTALKKITIPATVTSIGTYAFAYSGVTSLTIPESVISIENYAFKDCTSLTSISIAGSVTNIGNYAFNGCTGLKVLRLEDGATKLTLGYNSFNSNGTGKGLFRDCPLESLYVGRNLDYASYKSSSSNFTYSIYPQYFGYSAFANIASTLETIPELNVEIGANVTSIPMYMFYGCKGLKSVTIAESAQITSIGNYAFYDCTALKKITIPATVTSIGTYAFAYSGVTSLTIPESVISIENYAFKDCTSLTSISIAGSVTSIKNYAFNGCTGLKTLRLEDGTTTLSLGYKTYTSSGTGKGLFYDCPLESIYVGRNLTYTDNSSGYSYTTYPQYYGYSAFAQNKTANLEVEIGANVTSIAIYMFDACTGLNKVTVSSSAQITTIGRYAFYNCKALETITIPETVTSIYTYAFAYSGVTSLTIPKSVISIGNCVFNGCTGLKTLRLEDGGVTLSLGYHTYSTGSNAKGLFRDCPLEDLYLGRKLTYTDNSSGYLYTEKQQYYGWSAFADITSLANVEISVPEGLTSFTIGKYAFSRCGITSATITPATGWKRSSNSSSSTGTSIEEDLSDESVAASCLVDSADGYYLHWVAPQQ